MCPLDDCKEQEMKEPSVQNSANDAGQQSSWQVKLAQAWRRVPATWRKRWHWGVIGVLLVCLVVVLFANRSESPPVARRIAPDTMSFPVGSQPTLIFAHSIGNVHITRGAAGQVLIKEMKNGFPDAIQIRYQQNGDKITTTSDIQGGLMQDTWVDFDVSVPDQDGAVVILQNGGTLEANGLSGPMTLSNTNGSIWATNLNGAVSLKSDSGSLNASHVTGQMTISTRNGTITTSDVHLQGHSSVQAESGTINFHGSLDTKGSYLFENGNGAVGLTLARGAAFRVDARTTSGAINLTYPGMVVQHLNHASAGSRSEARGNVGKPPMAELTIQTSSGPITVSGGG